MRIKFLHTKTRRGPEGDGVELSIVKHLGFFVPVKRRVWGGYHPVANQWRFTSKTTVHDWKLLHLARIFQQKKTHELVMAYWISKGCSYSPRWLVILPTDSRFWNFENTKMEAASLGKHCCIARMSSIYSHRSSYHKAAICKYVIDTRR